MALQCDRDSVSFLKDSNRIINRQRDEERKYQIQQAHEKTMIAIAIERFVNNHGYNLQTMPPDLRMHVNTAELNRLQGKKS